jgi:ATP/maltotriose-dependent transcriptional regulator MalT
MALADHLVGRAEELGSIDNLLAQIDGGESAALELLGEPGIGKTRVLAELAVRADARGHIVLSGCAADLERDLPFWVFVDALDEFLQGLDPRRLDALDDDVQAELATVFPSLAKFGGGREIAIQHERYRSHRAVRALLERLAQTQPVVLLLDDVHWADPASVELLGALLHRPPAARVLVALAVRPRQMGERLSAAVERAHRAGTLARVELNALTPEEARALVGETLGARDSTQLYQESGGNPFYLEQLARSATRPGVSASAPELALADLDVPPPVAAALAEELALLSEEARTVLEGAAVAGDRFDPELAAAAAGTPDAAAIDALDELLRLDLVRYTEVPRRFRFRHPLVRRAVYDASPAGWRLHAHQRTAEALAGRGASAAAQAHHVERSARDGDADAIALLCEAGHAAAQRTPGSAAHWFGAALRLLSPSAAAAERVEILTALAEAQAATGQFGAARATLVETLDLLSDEEITSRARLTAACAGVEQVLGMHEEANTRLETALQTIDERGSPQAAALMISLASGAFFRQAHTEARDWGARALRVASDLGDAPLIAAATAVVALVAPLIGEIGVAEAHSSEAAALIDALPDEQLALRLDAIAYLAAAELYLNRFEASTSHARRGLTVARATGQGELLPMLVQALARALSVQGRLVEAAHLLDGAIEGARLAGNDQTLAWDLLNRAFVAVQLGDLAQARETGEESFALTRDLGEGAVSTYAGAVLAIVRLEMGEPALAAELFISSAGGDALPLVPGVWRASYLELLTRCWLLSGRPAEAARSAAHAQAIANATGLHMARAWAERAAASVAADRGDAAAAVAHALASAASADAAGAPVEAALSRTLAGRALRVSGDRDRAIAELEQAVATLGTHSAARYRLQAERELGKLGRRPHRRTRPGKVDATGVDSLTERELEIARLVVDRKTNPEIAAELFLSLKTVQSHLHNTFRKLGVTSRVEVARVLERADRGA